MHVACEVVCIVEPDRCLLFVAGLSHESIVMGARLGKGNFGDVYKARLQHNNQEVAVKTCRSENFGDAEKFLKEAKILEQYDHPNIVKLIGICSAKEPIYIVMELMLGGDFLTFLRKKGHGCSPKQLTEFGWQASAGGVLTVVFSSGRV